MVELLAPVGGQEALVAAVESGADALYLSGKMFGARAFAPNFNDEELADAVRFSHLHSVRVYVTVNTLIDNSELPLLVRYLQYLYGIGVDGIIVQDVAVSALARKVAPGLPIHASTQMTVHNLAGVRFMAEHGFTRVVLARELSLTDIAHICQNTNIEIEVFVHGALCISYSGQCLMSSMIGGRSGNRGRCAQPCRLPYALVDKNGQDVLQNEDAGEYLLSPRDLNTLELLPKLLAAGVASLKIEGRMKRPEYVAIVVDTYRQAIEACKAGAVYQIGDEEQKRLAQIFNRDFTTAYLLGKQGRKMMSDRRPNNRGVFIGRVVSYDAMKKQVGIKLEETLAVGDIIEFWVKVGGRVNVTVTELQTAGQKVDFVPSGAEATLLIPTAVRVSDRVFKVFDEKLTHYARSFFANVDSRHRIPLFVQAEVQEGRPLHIQMRDADGFIGEAQTNFVAQKAINRPLTEETVAKQLSRLGNTIFEMQELVCLIQGEVMVPVSEINDARRRAVDLVEQARLDAFDRPPLHKVDQTVILREMGVSEVETRKLNPRPLLSIAVDSVSKVKVAIDNGADIILFGGETYDKPGFSSEDYNRAYSLTKESGKAIVFNTPRLLQEWHLPQLESDLRLFASLQPDAVSVANAGTLQLARQYPQLILHGDYSLNIYNTIAVNFFASEGLSNLTLSPELNFTQIANLTGQKHEVSLECLVHGYLPLMISEYCLPGSFLGGIPKQCNNPCHKEKYWLRDRLNERFPVVTDQFCRMHILNAKAMSLLPHVHRFRQLGIDRIRIEGRWSMLENLAVITRLYRDLLDADDTNQGWANDRIASVEHNDITRGHYFRGIL